MDILELPFVSKLGIQLGSRPYELQMPFDASWANHLGLWYAGLEFSLAETASGYFLMQRFSHLEAGFVPLLRDASIRFRSPAQGTLHALPEVVDEAIEQFEAQIARRGRAKIQVDVQVLEADDRLVAQAEYQWFIQRNDDEAR